MIRRMIALTLVGISALSGTASATTKVTPALPKNADDSFVCRVANIGSTPVDASVQILSSTGAVLRQQDVSQPSGWTQSVVYTGGSAIGYCRVDGSYSRKRVLVTLCVTPPGSIRCESPVGDPGL